MRPQWPMLCLALLLVTPASTLAGDVRLLNAGVRGGASGLEVLGGSEDEHFQQYDLFATASLPWSKYWYGWGFSTRLMGTTGVLIGAGDAGFVGTIVPLLAFGPKDSILALDGGVGAALVTPYKFGEQTFGGASSLRSLAVRLPVLVIGYRMAHMSAPDLPIHGRGHFTCWICHTSLSQRPLEPNARGLSDSPRRAPIAPTHGLKPPLSRPAGPQGATRVPRRSCSISSCPLVVLTHPRARSSGGDEPATSTPDGRTFTPERGRALIDPSVPDRGPCVECPTGAHLRFRSHRSSTRGMCRVESEPRTDHPRRDVNRVVLTTRHSGSRR